MRVSVSSPHGYLNWDKFLSSNLVMFSMYGLQLTTTKFCFVVLLMNHQQHLFPAAQNLTPLCLYNLNNGQNVCQSQQQPAEKKFSSYKHESIYV